MHETVIKHKRRGSLFHCASAQDLRCLDMEKEKQDVSSPRGVLEAYATAFESDTVTPENSTSELESRPNSRAVSHWRKFFKLWNKRSIKRLASFPPLGVPKISIRKCKNERESPLLTNVYNFKSSLVNFTFSELQAATNNFSEENVIGKGGYAKVYRGCLRNGQLIAVKRLIKGTADEKTAAFLSELGIIAHVDHPNTAKLFGCCIEGGMHLVFQLSSFGSLGSLLHGSKDNKLDWSKRYKIALGTADGLLYLHESCQRRIIHRDIKADNILLTQDYEAQICDFGLAKWLPEQLTHHNVSKFEGTFGYFAPEYFMHGIVDEKTDVYSFGVLLLELITGRRALDDLQQSLVIWSKPLLDGNNIKELVDPALGDKYDSEEIDRVVLTASLCIEQSPILRPRMSQVVILLRGDEYVAECAKECRKSSLQRTYSEELLDADEYNSTKYLNDLNRHKQVAFSS
ncbi:receptor-like cytosolic serine/threonine-protein kinase RBK2 [Ziziphus jujuba]|uniref:non-specific serine/threonine protein kinase n=1 Tax=Ziziphus jujuba TaxID=326968 RepID=A0A6P6FVL1_ZIZJJ|nr:receptor-like cytosolic serine/threonine-protein kinase RBK2 [Ziziphus jujuba]XP_015875270.1 receptor-like cytosolic serine/threonine-protein kinase RBK2 [Ziziphus jujuba]XP_024926057.1 receptor-like cytosolic serine/threonine-protein kinase RBK2 [Ziziphus jujuba]XP_024926059.1 receptor-like cytosolic serine/threonine-protein kinase RBK2 [Ziziphus jujuba]XP_048323760.1 receptor-like cytosolic serine/threonine-protein kinase RBK2 [Ziziphus jujuba var. spinosa]XP_048323761.1 receptor-like cyt